MGTKNKVGFTMRLSLIFIFLFARSKGNSDHMSDTEEPVSLRSMIEVVSKQRNPDLDDGETLTMGDPNYVKDIFHKYKLRQYLALKALFDNTSHSEDHHPL